MNVLYTYKYICSVIHFGLSALSCMKEIQNGCAINKGVQSEHGTPSHNVLSYIFKHNKNNLSQGTTPIKAFNTTY